MRLSLAILFIGAIAVFFWQNQQPISLVFLGSLVKITFPLAGWVLLFAAAGALSSLFLQAINALGRPAKRSLPQPFTPYPPPPPRKTREKREAAAPSMPPPAISSDWQSPPPEEWDDWLEETPPTPPTPPPQTKREKPPSEPTALPLREEQLRTFEVPQQPESTSREGSVYSYRYREPRDRPQDSQETQQPPEAETERVYDATYRVITPPYPNPEPEEDEDWV